MVKALDAGLAHLAARPAEPVPGDDPVGHLVRHAERRRARLRRGQILGTLVHEQQRCARTTRCQPAALQRRPAAGDVLLGDGAPAPLPQHTTQRARRDGGRWELGEQGARHLASNEFNIGL